MLIITSMVFGVFGYWILKKWDNHYFKGDELLETRTYLNRNVFWYMPRKIYRPPSLTNGQYDIFVLLKVDRLRKINNYILVDMDDQVIN